MRKEIVIDCSVSASWVLPDETTEKSKSLLSEVLCGRVFLVEPILWHYETNNLLRTAVLRKRLTQELALKSLALLEEIPMEFVPPTSQNQAGILLCSLRNELSAYDASYFHLAESRGLELVSADKDLLQLQSTYSWITDIHEYTI